MRTSKTCSSPVYLHGETVHQARIRFRRAVAPVPLCRPVFRASAFGIECAARETHETSVKTLRHGSRARVAAVGVAAGVLLAGCGAANEQAPAGGSGGVPAGGPALSGTISGAGASSQQAAMQAWIAGFTGANPDATVNYDPSGSGAGRTQFVAGGVARR